MTNAKLDGKVAIVTGAAKGLGAADTELMIDEGAQVVAVDIDRDALMELANRCGESCTPYVMDVTDRQAWNDLAASVEKQFGLLNILVNNAGIVAPGTILSQTEDEYRKQMAVSADATFFGSQACLPLIASSGIGSIINMCSIASVQGESFVLGYSAAKGAVEAMTRAIAAHCAQNFPNVRCNSIHPSGIDTPMVREMPDRMAKAGLSSEMNKRQESPSENRLGQSADIAAIVSFLASDDSRFINGASIRADRGISILAGTLPAPPT